MKKKKLVAASLIAFGLVGIQTPLYAQVVTSNSEIVNLAVPAIDSVQDVSEKAPLNLEMRLSKLIALGEKSVADRTLKLGALKTKIQASKITTTQKQALVDSIDAEVTNLNSLLANIKSSTSTASAKSLDNSVYTDYRVLAVFIPQEKILSSAYTLENHLTKLDDVFTKAQARIDTKKTSGKDVTILQQNLDSAKALEATISSNLNDVVSKANSMKPADYPVVSKATIKALNQSLKTVTADFKKINSILKSKTKAV